VAFLEFYRVSEHQAVALALARLLVLHDDQRAKADFVGGDLGDVDLRKLAQSLPQLTESRLDELLPLERGLVLAVLAQVA
jgi:hypothetical protein